MFESSPQSKCAVAYTITSDQQEEVYLIVVYSVVTSTPLRMLRSESEVTQMCTPGDDSILIAGTVHGSVLLYDLKELVDAGNARNYELNYDALMRDEGLDPGSEEYQSQLQGLRSRYSVQWPTFSTDGIAEYVHFSPICRLQFITKFGGSTAQIGVIDELLVLSTWSVVELGAVRGINEHDLTLSVGGRFKLLQNYAENLILMPEVAGVHDAHDVSQSLELEFDNTDPNTFYFSTVNGLFKYSRRESGVPVRLDTTGMGAPTALSMSDRGYLLVGFTCGSIA